MPRLFEYNALAPFTIHFLHFIALSYVHAYAAVRRGHIPLEMPTCTLYTRV